MTVNRSRQVPPVEREHQLPSIDRAWELAERAYDTDGLRVLGWADDAVMLSYSGRLNFDVHDRVQRSHEDEVLIVAIRVPHPDEMPLDEVINSLRGPHIVVDPNGGPGAIVDA
jgi:hypothetical protein